MKEIKFTTDGKKVVVIGDLNQTEKIVQEIFVTDDGEEIPSGERFVVKSLLDWPAKSWKEIELQKLEERYYKEKEKWERDIEQLNKEKKIAYLSLHAHVKWLRNVAKQPFQEQIKRILNQLADFLSDTPKWIVVTYYSNWMLQEFNERGMQNLLDRFSYAYDAPKFEGMRLLSLYGDSNGNLEYRISDYGDGSGYEKDKSLNFFNSKEEALVFLQNKLDYCKEYNSIHIDTAKKYGLKLDDEKLLAYKNRVRASVEKDIASAQNNLLAYQNRLKELEQLESW